MLIFISEFFNKSEAQAVRVAPVVSTSSTKSRCMGWSLYFMFNSNAFRTSSSRSVSPNCAKAVVFFTRI